MPNAVELRLRLKDLRAKETETAQAIAEAQGELAALLSPFKVGDTISGDNKIGIITKIELIADDSPNLKWKVRLADKDGNPSTVPRTIWHNDDPVLVKRGESNGHK